MRKVSDIIRKHLALGDEVREAIESGRPVVALESTIISHGMPYPQNVETARRVESIVRDNGAVPATVAIMGGRIVVGLDDYQLNHLATAGDVIKTSRRDIPFVLGRGMTGATTVASTMIIAELSGIGVFVTGGIGGVHRGAERSFDISADLQELARTNVAVVCAGVKSILDIGLTLEYLETHGVPVAGICTDDFPAFYTRKSGFRVDYRCDDMDELAEAIRIKWGLGIDGGVLVANPIPAEYEMDRGEVERAIDESLREAADRNISGKEITPFLLSRVKEKTGGESLRSNIELVCSNAAAGARLAASLSK